MQVDFESENRIELQTRLLYAGEGGLYSLAFSVDGMYLVCFGGEKGIVWKTNEAEKVAEFDYMCPDLPVFSPSGSFVASCGSDGVEVWRHAAGSLTGHYSASLADNEYAGNPVKLFFSDLFGGHLYLLTDHCLFMWDITEKHLDAKRRLPAPDYCFDAIETSNGLLLYTMSHVDNSRTRLLITTALHGEKTAETFIDGDGMRPLVTCDGSCVAVPVGGMDKHYAIWFADENRQVRIAEPDIIASGKHRLIINDDLIVGSNRINVWDLRTSSLINSIEFMSSASPILSSSISTGVLAATSVQIKTGNGVTVFLKPRSGLVLGRTCGHTGEYACHSPDGRWFASVVDHNFLIDNPLSSVPIGTVYLTDLSPILSGDGI